MREREQAGQLEGKKKKHTPEEAEATTERSVQELWSRTLVSARRAASSMVRTRAAGSRITMLPKPTTPTGSGTAPLPGRRAPSQAASAAGGW